MATEANKGLRSPSLEASSRMRKKKIVSNGLYLSPKGSCAMALHNLGSGCSSPRISRPASQRNFRVMLIKSLLLKRWRAIRAARRKLRARGNSFWMASRSPRKAGSKISRIGISSDRTMNCVTMSNRPQASTRMASLPPWRPRYVPSGLITQVPVERHWSMYVLRWERTISVSCSGPVSVRPDNGCNWCVRVLMSSSTLLRSLEVGWSRKRSLA